jgi:hypothetical protein
VERVQVAQLRRVQPGRLISKGHVKLDYQHRSEQVDRAVYRVWVSAGDRAHDLRTGDDTGDQHGFGISRFKLTAEASALNEVVAAARQAIACSEVETAERAECLVHLADLLGRARNGLDEAERIGWQALRECPPDHSGRPTALSGFAGILWQRYLRVGDPGELDEAS